MEMRNFTKTEQKACKAYITWWTSWQMAEKRRQSGHNRQFKGEIRRGYYKKKRKASGCEDGQCSGWRACSDSGVQVWVWFFSPAGKDVKPWDMQPVLTGEAWKEKMWRFSKYIKPQLRERDGGEKRGTKQQHVWKLKEEKAETCTEGGCRVHEELPPLPHVPINRICWQASALSIRLTSEWQQQ